MNLTINTPWRRAGAAASAALVLVLASACGGQAEGSPSTQASSVTIKDPWVKAADTGMTAAFGTLGNSSDQEVRVVSASAASVTAKAQLHEMAADDSGQMVMREKPNGIALPAGKSHELKPGGDHIMLLDLIKPVRAGDDVRITLTFADKSTKSFTAPARSFSGAAEDYTSGTGGMSDMDMPGNGG